MPGDVGEVLGQVAGELRLDRLGDGAVQRDPVGGRQRRLDRVAGERVDEPVVADVADAVEQAVRDRLVDERKAPRDGSSSAAATSASEKSRPTMAAACTSRRHVRGDAVEPGADDVEHACAAAGPDARCRRRSPGRPRGRTAGCRR